MRKLKIDCVCMDRMFDDVKMTSTRLPIEDIQDEDIGLAIKRLCLDGFNEKRKLGYNLSQLEFKLRFAVEEGR